MLLLPEMKVNNEILIQTHTVLIVHFVVLSDIYELNEPVNGKMCKLTLVNSVVPDKPVSNLIKIFTVQIVLTNV